MTEYLTSSEVGPGSESMMIQKPITHASDGRARIVRVHKLEGHAAYSPAIIHSR